MHGSRLEKHKTVLVALPETNTHLPRLRTTFVAETKEDIEAQFNKHECLSEQRKESLDSIWSHLTLHTLLEC